MTQVNGINELTTHIRRAIEIRDGVIRNPKILSFQRRSAEFSHTPI
jgi:hypothetical protein